jgi:hypothetical protein
MRARTNADQVVSRFRSTTFMIGAQSAGRILGPLQANCAYSSVFPDGRCLRANHGAISEMPFRV